MSDYFTNDRFVARTARFRPRGATVRDVQSGPGYVASRQPGLLCGYTAAQVSSHYGLNAAYAKGIPAKAARQGSSLAARGLLLFGSVLMRAVIA